MDPTGRLGPTRGQSRGPGWRRTSLNRFVPARIDVDESAQRVAEVAAALPPDGVITGWGSLHLLGACYFDGRDARMRELPVRAVVPLGRHRRPVPRAVVHRESFSPGEVVMRRGVPCMCVERSIFDEMRFSADLRAAVEVIDMACYGQLTSIRRFRAYAASQPRRAGVGIVARALDLAVEGAQSRPEVQMRLIWTCDAGLPDPLSNVDVFDLSGRFLARPDLLDLETGVVGEYDGRHHDPDRQRSRDNTREQRLRDHGLEYFSVVRGEMEPGVVAARMHAARKRARGNGLSRLWTVERPPTLQPSLSLDEILDRRPPPA